MQDLTTGSPLPKILLFSLPLILGSLFQQLYNFADTVIIGQFLGLEALAAVGVTYSLNFLIIGFVQGSCVGFGIPISQSFGAKDVKNLHRYLWNGVFLGIVLSILLAAVTTLSAGFFLRLIHTPADIYDDALTYIRVIFLGIPATMMYNYSASVLRAMGDSRHPFYFLLFSCFLNIGLDYVAVVPLGMGVVGAAIATVFSQLVSGLLGCWWLVCRVELFRVRREEMSVSAPHLRYLCVIGLPMGFEYSVAAIGAIAMQNAINTMGSTIVAAQTAGEKIRQIFTLPMESVGMAMATYTGQNLGAKQYGRIRQGIRDGLLIQLVYSLCSWALLVFLKRPLTGLVMGTAAGEAADASVLYLTLISLFFLLHGSLMVTRNVLQGLGHSLQAVLSGFAELFGRSAGAVLALAGFGYAAICFSNPLAWGLALLYCTFMVARCLRRLQGELIFSQ